MLPAEIWLQICEQLCLHCNASDMPDFNLPEYEQGKSALAALSLTSQAMRDLSQPVLYHCMYHYPHENTATKFLRALIFHPRLASYVRVLSLPGGLGIQSGLGHKTECDTRRDVQIFHQVSVTFNLPTPRWVLQALSEEASPNGFAAFDGPGQDSRLQYSMSSRRPHLAAEFRAWKQLLIMALCCSGLTHLALSSIIIDGPVQHGQLEGVFMDPVGPRQGQHIERPFNFANLRVFSCEDESFCEDYPWFFAQAPRLNSIAVGWTYWPSSSLARHIPPIPLTNVSALSIACGPSYLAYMLRLCNQVRDLEFHLIDDASMEALTHAPLALSDPWPTSIKNQLRRLVWSHRAAYRGMGDEFLGSLPPLKDLRNLEILEIDCRSLSTCLRRGLDPSMSEEEVARQLPTVLPHSIRILHFANCTQSWATLLIELDELAEAKKMSLPMLSLIQIEEDSRVLSNRSAMGNRITLLEFMEALGVVSAMKDLGIELRIGLESYKTRPVERGSLLPPVPGNLHRRLPIDMQDEVPVTTFALED